MTSTTADRTHPNVTLAVLALGSVLGGQISATFIAGHTARGLPTVTGSTETFVMATGFLIVCLLAGVAIPKGLMAPAATDDVHGEMASVASDGAQA